MKKSLVSRGEKYLTQARKDVGRAWIEIERMELIILRAKRPNTFKSKLESNPTK